MRTGTGFKSSEVMMKVLGSKSEERLSVMLGDLRLGRLGVFGCPLVLELVRPGGRPRLLGTLASGCS